MIQNRSMPALLYLATMAARLSPFRQSIVASLIGAGFTMGVFLIGPQSAPAPEWMARAGESMPPLRLAEAEVRLAQTQAAVPKQDSLAVKQPTQAQAPRPAQIDRNGVLILVRSALLALDQANKTGNYTVLRDLGSPEFQANSAARLAEIFAQQRKDNIDLSGVSVIDPQLTVLPQIEANGVMRMAGFFPSFSTQVNFEMVYAPVDGRWRLFTLSVWFGQAVPVAPQPPGPAASAAVQQR